MALDGFTLHDISRFPLVVLHGKELPHGYSQAWVKEFEALLAQERKFALVFPSSTEVEDHQDQKLRLTFLKANKQRLAAKCVGIFSVEPNKALRLVKRMQGAAIAVAFGFCFRAVATVEEANDLARLALAGNDVPDNVEDE